MTKYFCILLPLLILSFSTHAENLDGRISQLTEENIVIEIYHCTSCGFRSRASLLAEEIDKEFGLKANLIAGDVGSFDVYINESLIFSKFEDDRFPEPGEIVQKINEYKNNNQLSNTLEEK